MNKFLSILLVLVIAAFSAAQIQRDPIVEDPPSRQKQSALKRDGCAESCPSDCDGDHKAQPSAPFHDPLRSEPPCEVPTPEQIERKAEQLKYDMEQVKFHDEVERNPGIPVSDRKAARKERKVWRKRAEASYASLKKALALASKDLGKLHVEVRKIRDTLSRHLSKSTKESAAAPSDWENQMETKLSGLMKTAKEDLQGHVVAAEAAATRSKTAASDAVSKAVRDFVIALGVIAGVLVIVLLLVLLLGRYISGVRQDFQTKHNLLSKEVEELKQRAYNSPVRIKEPGAESSSMTEEIPLFKITSVSPASLPADEIRKGVTAIIRIDGWPDGLTPIVYFGDILSPNVGITESATTRILEAQVPIELAERLGKNVLTVRNVDGSIKYQGEIEVLASAT